MTKKRPPLLPEDYDDLDFSQEEPSLTLDDLDELVKPPPPRPPKVTTPPEERYPPVAFPEEKPEQPQEEASTPPRKRRRGRWYHDVIAFIFLLATCGLAYYYSLIWNDPYSSLNPLAPPTPFVVVSETPDIEAIIRYHATQTAEAGGVIPVPQQATPTPGIVVYPFALGSEILYTPNTNSSGCNWASIAGSVTDINGQPLNNYGVQIQHAQDPSQLDVKVFSGSAQSFGEGGFELIIGGAPQAGEFTIQLFSPAGAPVSEFYTVTTRATCEENVAVVNLVQIQAF